MGASAGYLKFAGNKKSLISASSNTIYYPDTHLYAVIISTSLSVGDAGIVGYDNYVRYNMTDGQDSKLIAFIKTGASSGYTATLASGGSGTPAGSPIWTLSNLLYLDYDFPFVAPGDEGQVNWSVSLVWPRFRPDFTAIPAPSGTILIPECPDYSNDYEMNSHCGAQYGKDWSSGTAPDWQTVFTPDDGECGTIHAVVQEGSTYQYQVWGYIRIGSTVTFQKGAGEAGFVDIGNATNKCKIQNSSGAVQIGLTANATLKVRVRLNRYQPVYT